MFDGCKVIVAIPVKNEVDRIGMCIAALAGQTRPFDELFLLLNNCTDGTFEACRATDLKGRITTSQYTLPPEFASAGEARRLALAHALMICGNGIILTTDADALPRPDWIEKNLDAIGGGADVVCGQACLLPGDHALLPARLHHDDLLEATLLDLLDEIDSLIDPDPFDPWPRHQHDSGASIAMRASTLRQAGGAPHVSTGEDRALITRFRNMDARIRHDPDINVPVSGRLDGRAENGMAATIKRRIETPDEWTDERLEPAIDRYRRALAKAGFRAARLNASDPGNFAKDLLIPAPTIRDAFLSPYFGAAWEMVQAASPVLRRRRVAFANIGREIRQATQLRNMLRMDSDRLAFHEGRLAVG